MAVTRPTMRQLSDERNRQARADMELAIAENRLTVRQMTSAERREADVHRAAHAKARAARATTRRG
jgi:hypothetical protein